jgi:putative mRNA 3-end processing factor
MIPCRPLSSGFLLPNQDIALDVASPVASHCFVSHAHADHVPKSRSMRVYATPATATFMRIRGFKGEINELEFYEPVDLPNARVTLFPAGHILGSAMVYVESDEGTLLYTGDFRNPPSLTSDGFSHPERVDTLITEATFSLPIYRWKSHEELYGDIQQFATDALSDGAIPVFYGYSLGKTQEILHALAGIDESVYVHESGYSLCNAYEQFGISFGPYAKLGKEIHKPAAVIAPSSADVSALWASPFPVRTAYVSGWAAADNRSISTGADAAIALSDHVDFFELIEWINILRPDKTFVTHSPHPEVVCHFLEKLGLEASPI